MTLVDPMPSVILENQVELYYDQFGHRNDDAVLLISGAGAPATIWPDAFCEDLADEGFLVTRYSNRDTGFSTHFDQPYDIHALLEDIEQFLDAVVRRRCHLVGHSMGGYLVQLAMCGFPEKLISGTSISAGSAVTEKMHVKLGTSTPDPNTWEILTRNLPSGDFEKDLAGWMTSWEFLNGDIPLDRGLATAYTRSLYEGDPRNAQVATNHVHAMGTIPESLVTGLPDCPVPLLVLNGDKDPLVPSDNGEATARLARNGDFHILDRAGHMFFNHKTWKQVSAKLLRHFRAAAKTP